MAHAGAAVRKQIVVDAPIERAFTVFTDRFGDFKPPEHNLLGSPIAETVTSMRVPCVPKGGRLAVTMTAATLPVVIVWPRTLTPRRSSIACSDCLVNGLLLSESPVPLRPTTRPYPIN